MCQKTSVTVVTRMLSGGSDERKLDPAYGRSDLIDYCLIGYFDRVVAVLINLINFRIEVDGEFIRSDEVVERVSHLSVLNLSHHGDRIGAYDFVIFRFARVGVFVEFENRSRAYDIAVRVRFKREIHAVARSRASFMRTRGERRVGGVFKIFERFVFVAPDIFFKERNVEFSV